MLVSPKHLRPVADGETAEQSKAKTLSEAVAGSERDLLVMMRSKVASEIDKGVPAHALDKLMPVLRECDRDIRAIDALGEDGVDDEPVQPAVWDEGAI